MNFINSWIRLIGLIGLIGLIRAGVIETEWIGFRAMESSICDGLHGNDLEGVRRDYERSGVVRVRGVFSPDTVESIRKEIDRYVRDDLPGLPADARTLEADGVGIRNLWRMERYNSFFKQFAGDVRILALVRELVNGDPVLMGVETFNKPARVGSGVPYHQDNAYFCQKPPDVLTMWIAIDPVTTGNGPVYYVVGSHRAGLKPHAASGVKGNSFGLASAPEVAESEQFRATLDPGDAVIHHCETIHHSAPNRTDQSRLGLLLVYRGAHTVTDPVMQEAYHRAIAATPPA